MFKLVKSLILPASLAGLAMATLPALADGQGRAVPAVTTNVVMSGKVCKTALFSETGAYVPDDTFLDNVGASVVVKKGCKGAIITEFQGETTGSIWIYGTATCIGTGGYNDPCTVGTRVYSSNYGGSAYMFANNTTGVQGAHAGTFIFKALKRGKWRIDVLLYPGVTGSLVGYRSLVANAYVGG